MASTRPVDLGRGGASWEGWRFSRYGRAREWRLIAPDGTTYTQAEIQELPAMLADLDYLRARIGELEASTVGIPFTPAEAAALAEAVAVLARRLPTRTRRAARATHPGAASRRFLFRSTTSHPSRAAHALRD